ncbi:MAG: hypothetical protein GXO43_02415 [Crenarchaeota archaeon]|nr:hypothetical protein [Thermoproteota archaeon]
MNTVLFRSGPVKIAIRSVIADEISRGLNTSFARRYIPDFTLETVSGEPDDPDAVINWESSSAGFKVEETDLSGRPEEYTVKTPAPAPYVNEAPYFFILQVLSRLYAKKNMVVFTDTVSFVGRDGEAIVLMGYPHSGKSTITAIALHKGYIPLTTENTVIDFSRAEPLISGGTSILVYDPVIKDLYGVSTPVHDRTRHGYVIVDLDKVVPERRDRLGRGVRISRLYVLHCSFSSVGADQKPIRGRKIRKTLWYFATALVKGVDYYDPYPLDLGTVDAMKPIGKAIMRMSDEYGCRFFEVYGRHDEVFKMITGIGED